LALFLPEDGRHVPQHVGEAHLMLVLITNVHLVGKRIVYTVLHVWSSNPKPYWLCNSASFIVTTVF